MWGGSEIYFRVLYLLGAVGVLLLLRKPLRYPDRPGSRWFALVIVAVAAWLGGVGLYYFEHSRAGSFALYCLVLFSISVCFAGWLLVAIEFSTGRSAPRVVVAILCVLVIGHLLLLVTNYAIMHELIYRQASFVDEGGGLNVKRGPIFWVHITVIYVLVFLSTALFGAEWSRSNGLRRRQAGMMLITPVFGMGASILWFAEVLPFPFDPTPMGVTLGVILLGWVLYRSKFVEIVPIARRAVVEEMADAVVILDAEDRVIDWNTEAAHLFDAAGASAGVPAERFFDSIPDGTLERLTNAARTETRASIELDGAERHYSVSISPIESDDARPLGRAVVIRDVTDDKRREAQLLKQNEYLDRFAGIVSHDIQGPLMEIRGSADSALRTGDTEPVEHVLEATDRIERQVDDLLHLARTGRRVEAVEPVSLSDAAEAAWRRIWNTRASLSIQTEQVIQADHERLLQLLENLFRNGVEHARPERPDGSAPIAAPDSTGLDGRVDADPIEDLRLTIGPLPGGFYVEDDGTGIPPAERDRVFERGYTTDVDGSGLGLSIVRQIAAAHGWAIRVTDGPDGGARFEITGVDETVGADDYGESQ